MASVRLLMNVPRGQESIVIHPAGGKRNMLDPKVVGLRDMTIKKMLELDRARFWDLYDMRDALALSDMADDALTAMGIREKTNHNDGPEVEAVQRVAGGSRGDAWCMFKEQFRIGMAEVLTGKVSLYPRTGSCASARERMPKSIQIAMKDLRPGSNCIKRYANGKGHTGDFNNWMVFLKIAQLNEGNTTAGWNGSREGGGQYLTKRNFPKESDGVWVMFVNPFEPMGDIPAEKSPIEVAPDMPTPGIYSLANLALQRAINIYEPKAKLKEDGWYGDKTKEAAAKIQKRAGMTGTGVVGPLTLKLLGLPVPAAA